MVFQSQRKLPEAFLALQRYCSAFAPNTYTLYCPYTTDTPCFHEYKYNTSIVYTEYLIPYTVVTSLPILEYKIHIKFMKRRLKLSCRVRVFHVDYDAVRTFLHSLPAAADGFCFAFAPRLGSSQTQRKRSWKRSRQRAFIQSSCTCQSCIQPAGSQRTGNTRTRRSDSTGTR